MILSQSHKDQTTSFIIEPGLLLSTLLLLLTHSVTDYELGPYTRARLSIDLTHTLQWLAHCTHTTKPMASHSYSGWTNGVLKNPIYCHGTLPATLTNTPFGFSPRWPRTYQRSYSHRCGKNGPKWGQSVQTTPAHKAYAVLPVQGSARG